MFPTPVGSGWGTISRVLGLWTDYSNVNTGLNNLDSQIGVALATEIYAGSRGATITHIHAEAPANVGGTIAPIPFRLLVISGPTPKNLEPFQRALQGYPALGAPDLPSKVLFERVISSQTSANNANGSPGVDIEFGHGGPSISSGDIMTVLYCMLNNENGIPGYGANNRTWVSMSVYGVDEQIIGGGASGSDKDTRQRSIPRGMVSGI